MDQQLMYIAIAVIVVFLLMKVREGFDIKVGENVKISGVGKVVKNDDNRFDIPKGTTLTFKLKEDISIPLGTIHNVMIESPKYAEALINGANRLIDVKVNGNTPISELAKFKREKEVSVEEKMPTKSGCWVKASSCPKNLSYTKIVGKYNQWNLDKWGIKHRNAANNKNICLRRQKEFNNWCGIKDAKMYWNP